MKTKISKETVVNVAKTRSECDYYRVPSYSEAVKVILEEITFDSNRNEAIKVLRRDGDTEYYAAVIEAVKNCTFDSNRIQLIKTLSEKASNNEKDLA